jgi:DNA-binding MarR family transcriptional regulator
MSTDTSQFKWLDAEEQHAWRQFLHTGRLLEAAMDHDLQVRGLQLSEYEIIAVLSEQPGRRMRMSAMAEQVVQSRSRMTHTAGRLEKRGWVLRESCAGDRRGVELVLTDEGYDETLRLAPIHVRSVRANMVDSVSREEFLALGRTMETIGRVIEGRAEGDGVLDAEEQPA